MKILLDTNVLVYAHDPGDFDRMRDAIQILDGVQFINPFSKTFDLVSWI